ncbi:MAG: putative pilus assembly protein FilE, partial [Acinetobacter sp.]
IQQPIAVAEIKSSKGSALPVEDQSSTKIIIKTPNVVDQALQQRVVQLESKNQKQTKDVLKPKPVIEKVVQQPSPPLVVKQAEVDNTDAFVSVNGEKYIRNEYLEDKEFNLEGKKRFYAMPEGVIDVKHGATRLQLVEREKGVSKSIIQSLFKKNQKKESGPITLSSTYYRISQADVVDGLGQQCFQDKKIKNAKTVSLEKEVNLWPRVPLKDQFDFEIVKLSNAIQNIQINSYASRQQDPTFYWPFVVFLDANACVLEGAGGFKNHDAVASFTSHEKIEGVIHVPLKSQYILLTPLASAIDLENRALTNQGQLKLIAIR